VLFRIFSRQNDSRPVDRRTGRRALRFERLEDRQLLSIGPGVGSSASNAPQLPMPLAVQMAPAVPVADGTVNPGPTISLVTRSAAQSVITWNAADSDGVASSSLTVDGAPVAELYGPYAAPPGVNYAGVYGALSSGNHTYVITATDSAGNSSQCAGTFDVAGPTIGMLVVDPTQNVITWNAIDADGVASSRLTVDGTAVTMLYGPYAASSGVNFAGVYGELPSGNHTYVVTATNSDGNWTQCTGTFSVAGPTISRVVAAPEQDVITWNAAAPDGLASTTLAIDGAPVTKVYGPYADAPGADYAGVYSALSTASHSYVITATDSAGNSSRYTGTFVQGPVISSVVASLPNGLITWNASDLKGVKSSSLTVDGTPVTMLYGPYAATSGVNFSGVFGQLSPGAHTYVISVTDSVGESAQYAGTLLPGPTISDVTLSAAQKTLTWNTAASDGVSSSSLTVDGILVKDVQGPYAAATGVNYVWAYGLLSPGNHTYLISAVDYANNASQCTGTFTVPS
jgi:hypothetical protein